MKLLFICSVLLTLFSCSTPNNEAKIESLKVLESSTLDKYLQASEYLERMLDILADKTQSDGFLDKTRDLFSHMSRADSISFSLMDELNTLRSEIIEKKIPRSDQLNRPVTLEYTTDLKMNHAKLQNEEEINTIIKKIEIYRNELCRIVAESPPYRSNGKRFKLQIPKLAPFKNEKQKTRSILTALKQSDLNEEDLDGIVRIMLILTKNKSTWKAMLSADEDWIDLSMSLLSIQQQILEARFIALKRMGIRMGFCGNHNFTRTAAIPIGSSNALPGDTVQFQVLLAAYNEYYDQEVTVSEGARFIKTENGKAFFEAVVPNSGELKLTGEINIKSEYKKGKSRAWSHTIKVIEPK